MAGASGYEIVVGRAMFWLASLSRHNDSEVAEENSQKRRRN
jgi:hypothetical protein